MKILVQYPTKARPEQFRNNFPEWHKVSGKYEVRFCVILNLDDLSMLETTKWILTFPETQVKFGAFQNKIQAINHGLGAEPWDVVVFAHDDLWPADNWDVSVDIEMWRAFRDLDGALFYQDGHGGHKATAIMGRKLYDRFGYIYHPSYISLWADNEYEHVIMNVLKKGKRLEYCIMQHQSPAFTGQADPLYDHNSKFFVEDKLNYEKRRAEGFP